MPTLSTDRNYFSKFAFEVVIDGIVKAAFSKCTGLTGKTDVIEYYEGGEITPHKSPGLVTFGDITLERGETDDIDLYDWWKSIYDHRRGFGSANGAEYKRRIVIRQKDRAGAIRRSWEVSFAFPAEFGGDDWDNSASEHHIEHLVLAHEGFQLL